MHTTNPNEDFSKKSFLYDKNEKPIFFEDLENERKKAEQDQENAKRIKETENTLTEEFENSRLIIPKPNKIIKQLDKYVYGQADAKKKLALAMRNLEHRIKYPNLELPKSNTLFFGDTGCGKTLLVETLAKIVNLPLLRTKMSGLSPAGFHGETFANIFKRLEGFSTNIANANEFNEDEETQREANTPIFVGEDFIANAKYSLIYLDEIDKIAIQRNSENSFAPGMQDELISYIENADIFEGDMTTKDMLFVGTGAFVGLDKIIEKRVSQKGGMGFLNQPKSTKIDKVKLMAQVTPEDLIKYGFKPELIGRFPMFTGLDPLGKKELMKIINMDTGYLYKQREVLKCEYDITLRFTTDAKETIAEYTQTMGTNARGLQNAIERVLENTILNAEQFQEQTISFGAKRIEQILK